MLAGPGDLDALVAGAVEHRPRAARVRASSRACRGRCSNSRETASAMFDGPALRRVRPRRPRARRRPRAIDCVGVGDDQVRVDLQARAEAVAVDAHAERAVERERLRRQLGEADAALRAGARLAVGALARLALDSDAAARPSPALHRGLDRVGEAGPRRRRRCVTPVDHDLDGVLLLLVERGDVLEPLDHAVDAHARRSRPCAPRRAARGTRPCGSRPCGASSVTLRLAAAASGSRRRSRAAERAATSPPQWWQRCSPTRA